MRGVNAMLAWFKSKYKFGNHKAKAPGDLLICCIVQEDECNNSMGGTLALVIGEHRGTGCLQREEEQHATARRQEQEAATEALDEERRHHRDSQIPDLKDSVNKELDGRIRDANRVEDFVEIVGYETVAGPLREKCKGDDDPQALAVARLDPERFPSHVRGHGLVEMDSRLDLLEFILHKSVMPASLLVSNDNLLQYRID